MPTLDSRLLRPDGSRWLEITCATDVDARGTPRRYYGTALDITERKFAEAALRESETRLQLFIDHAPAALAMFDRQMRYLAVSRRWLTDYQLKEGDILGRSHYEVFAEIPERWKAVHRRALAGEVVRSDEDRFERLDGTVQWLRWEVRPWYAADGAVGGIVIFAEDVTARKQAEAGFRRQKDVLDRTGRLARVGAWEIDTATMQGTLTDEMVRIHGLEPGPEITGAQIMACLDDADRTRVEQAQQAAIERAEPYELQLQITTAKGERRWVHATGPSRFRRTGGSCASRVPCRTSPTGSLPGRTHSNVIA